MRTLKAFFSKLQNFRQTLQEKRAKREPNARVVKAVAFMNRYSILFHGILSCLLCFVIECISRRLFLDILFLAIHIAELGQGCHTCHAERRKRA